MKDTVEVTVIDTTVVHKKILWADTIGIFLLTMTILLILFHNFARWLMRRGSDE